MCTLSCYLSNLPCLCCFQEKLVATLFGMLRLHKLEFLDVYREETFTGMKAIVKQVWQDLLFNPLPGYL